MVVYPGATSVSEEREHVGKIVNMFSSDLEKLETECRTLMEMDLHPTVPVHPAIKFMMADAADSGMSPAEFARSVGTDSIRACIDLYTQVYVPDEIIEAYHAEMHECELKRAQCLKAIYKIARKHNCRIRWNGEPGFVPHYPDRFDIIKDARIIGMIQC